MALDIASLLSKRNPALIGLDISTTGVKLVELSKTALSGYRLERCAMEPLPRGAVAEGSIENIEQVADAIRRVCAKSGARTKLVALALPSSAVITKKIALPAGLSEEELEIQVETEASQYIPFSLDEVSLDFAVIGPMLGSADDIEVLLAASRKEKVEDRIAVAEAAGLKPAVMDIESYAARAAIERLIMLAPEKAETQITALFQIGAQSTQFFVLLNGRSLHERDLPFGGELLTQDIVRSYGFSPEEAEIKKKTGQLPAGYETDLLDPFLDSASLEVARAIQFFFTSTPYTRVDRIFLAGGVAAMQGLAERIADRTAIETSTVNTFDAMQIGPDVRNRHLQSDSPGYMVACGLALRRFAQ